MKNDPMAASLPQPHQQVPVGMSRVFSVAILDYQSSYPILVVRAAAFAGKKGLRG
jgi:hypothetical protein